MVPAVNIQKLNGLHISTGNVNAWKELHRHHFANPSEELSTCLKLQLMTVGKKDCKTIVRVTEDEYCELKQDLGETSIPESQRNDVKITLKVFLHDWDPAHVNACTASALTQLQTDRIELLIIAFPPPTGSDLDDQDVEDNNDEYPSLEQIIRIWNAMELLVDAGKIIAIGVADLDVSQLGGLCDQARIKPTVDHYNIAACCTVPPELQRYAKEHFIQLLTHNDPSDFLPKETVGEVLENGLVVSAEEAGHWTAPWVYRITAMVKLRSVITNKAYAVMLKKT